MVHLFDEPQFNLQDGYIGFMLDFFRKLRAEGRLVVLCLHPTASWHLEILAEIAEQFLLVADGGVTRQPDFALAGGAAAVPQLSRAGHDAGRRIASPVGITRRRLIALLNYSHVAHHNVRSGRNSRGLFQHSTIHQRQMAAGASRARPSRCSIPRPKR